jgi:hypothetical protein
VLCGNLIALVILGRLEYPHSRAAQLFTQTRNAVTTIALFAVIVCVFVILVAPDIDLPDSTVLRANDGVHMVATCIDLSVSIFLFVLAVRSVSTERKLIAQRVDAPSSPSLCTFLC